MLCIKYNVRCVFSEKNDCCHIKLVLVSGHGVIA